jgi:hypothetical protein
MLHGLGSLIQSVCMRNAAVVRFSIGGRELGRLETETARWIAILLRDGSTNQPHPDRIVHFTCTVASAPKINAQIGDNVMLRVVVEVTSKTFVDPNHWAEKVIRRKQSSTAVDGNVVQELVREHRWAMAQLFLACQLRPIRVGKRLVSMKTHWRAQWIEKDDSVSHDHTHHLEKEEDEEEER